MSAACRLLTACRLFECVAFFIMMVCGKVLKGEGGSVDLGSDPVGNWGRTKLDERLSRIQDKNRAIFWA